MVVHTRFRMTTLHNGQLRNESGFWALRILNSWDRQPGSRRATVYRGRAREVLLRCRGRGDADGDTLAALAKLGMGGAIREGAGHGDRSIFAAKDLFWYGKQTALQIVGKEYLKRDEPSRAIRPLEQLVKLRRHSDDWTLLGISRAKVGDLAVQSNLFDMRWRSSRFTKRCAEWPRRFCTMLASMSWLHAKPRTLTSCHGTRRKNEGGEEWVISRQRNFGSRFVV